MTRLGTPMTRLRRARAGLVASALALSGPLALPALGAPADLDPAFGNGGLVTTAVGNGSDGAAAVAIQPDGRIVVAGHRSLDGDSDFVVVRYEPTGGLDPSFGAGGIVADSFGVGNEQAAGVAIQPDGRIVVAGTAGTSFAVARYLASGALDPSFDGDGHVLTSFGAGAVDTARGVAVGADGRIVVAGDTASGGGHRAAAVRYNADGSLDPSFDGDGRLVAANPDSATQDVVADAVAVLPDGRVVLAGGTGPGCVARTGPCDFEISRWKADGTVDPTMDTDGESTTRIAGYDRAHALAMQPDLRTVAAGVSESGGVRRIAVTRYTGPSGPRPGNLDTSFGSGGIVTTPLGAGAEAWGVALQSDGRIVVSGTTASAGGAHDFVILRYQATGTLDTSFGSGGTVTTSFPGGNAEDRALAFEPDGRWVAAGSAVQPGGAKTDIAVARYLGELAGTTPGGQAGGTGPNPLGQGYRLVASDGGIFAFGDAAFRGSTGDIRLNRPIVATAPAPSGNGYWMVASDGGIFAFGDARFFGSTGNIRLAKPIVGMAATPSGGGYWLVASDGGIFAFGDAAFLGSTGSLKLAQPIVAMASTPSGRGYWMVASDGGIFAFGDASFHGSNGSTRLARPIVAMAPTPSGNGYWTVASDGGIFAFGDAAFLGSTGSLKLAKPIVGMTATTSGRGYWLAATDGGIFAFGDASFLGSTGNVRLARPIVGMAAS